MENLQENYSQDRWTAQKNGTRDPYGELRSFLRSISTDYVTVGEGEKAELNLPYEEELERLENPYQTGKAELYIVEETVDKEVSINADTVIDFLLGEEFSDYNLSQEKYAYIVPEKDNGVSVGGNEELVEHCGNVMRSEPPLSRFMEEAKVRGKNWKNGISSLLE